jgi:TonB family protein
VLLKNLKRFVAGAVLMFLVSLAAVGPSSAQEDGRRIKSKVPPSYPELAKRMGVTGVVKLLVTIAPNGTVKSAKVVGGHPLLVDPAMEAVRKWRYEPAATETTETVEFRFDNNN